MGSGSGSWNPYALPRTGKRRLARVDAEPEEPEEERSKPVVAQRPREEAPKPVTRRFSNALIFADGSKCILHLVAEADPSDSKRMHFSYSSEGVTDADSDARKFIRALQTIDSWGCTLGVLAKGIKHDNGMQEIDSMLADIRGKE